MLLSLCLLSWRYSLSFGQQSASLIVDQMCVGQMVFDETTCFKLHKGYFCECTVGLVLFLVVENSKETLLKWKAQCR
jgi:hypothetical protein